MFVYTHTHTSWWTQSNMTHCETRSHSANCTSKPGSKQEEEVTLPQLTDDNHQTDRQAVKTSERTTIPPCIQVALTWLPDVHCVISSFTNKPASQKNPNARHQRLYCLLSVKKSGRSRGEFSAQQAGEKGKQSENSQPASQSVNNSTQQRLCWANHQQVTPETRSESVHKHWKTPKVHDGIESWTTQ